MKKRILSLFLALTLCLTLLPTSAFAEGGDVSISDGVIGGGETGGEGGGVLVPPGGSTGEGGGIYAPPSGQAEGGGGTHIPGEDTRTEIWCVSKPDSIGRSYDGTTDGGTIPIDLTFTDGTNEIKLKEGTGFTAKKTFDSADAGWHTVTVEIALIGEAAVKYKLKAGEEKFEIGGNINKAYPDLTVSLSKTTCTVGEKLLPLLSVEGAPEDAEVTYYYAPINSGYLEFEGSEAVPKIDENTAISEPGTYYVYAKTGETKNYKEERSATVELTVNEPVVEAASVTRADGTDGGTYESLPAALNAAQDGDTVKLLANHVTDADALNALGEDFTFEQYASIVPVVTKTLTLDLNHKTVDYLEVGFSETNEETQKKETLATGNLTVTGEAAYGRISNLMFMAGALDIRSGEIGGSGCAGLLCDANSGSVTVSNGTVYGLTVMEGASVTVNGGSNHAGEWVVASGATLNITDGTFGDVQFTRNGTIAISGGTFQSIKSYIAEELQPLMSLLDTQKVHAFYKGDDVQDGNATELADVTVKEHTHTMVNNKCACGFSCTHTNAEGASTIGKDGKCTVCGTQFAAGIGETYYTDVPSALNAAADGQTIKLLANGMLPDGIYVSKTLTLDLDGHSLSGYSLNVGGHTATSQVRTGKLTVIDSSGGNGAVGVTVRDGGTLVFNPENDNTTLLQLEVWGGTVELYGGKISRSGLRLNNNITLGNLLPGQAGLAYYRGDTQLTLEEAASQTCDLVVKLCSHGGTNGFDGTNCPYCNAPAVAETALNGSEGSRLRRRFADLQTALDADRDGGSTLSLLTDVTGDYTINGTRDTGIDLNGHSIHGTVTVKAATGNSTTLSNTKNTTTASIDKVVAYKGAKLAGSGYPAVIGTLTLADTTQWKDILQQPTRLGFKVKNGDGTHKWYAPDDVKGSQLNNVIINSLPITTKTLNLKVDGKNLTGNSPKVERGTTVQLCASCNTKGAMVTFYVGERGSDGKFTYTQRAGEYQKIGTNWYYVADLDANTIGTYDIYFTASKDGYSVTSSHKKLTVTQATIPASAITAPTANTLTYNGDAQKLVAPGSVDSKYGTMQYSLSPGAGFSTEIPTKTDAGTYTVYYKVAGAEGYKDSDTKSINVTISPMKIDHVIFSKNISKTYDGTAAFNPVTADKASYLTFYSSPTMSTSVPAEVYEISDVRFLARNAEGEYVDSPEAGSKPGIRFTVTLNSENYVLQASDADEPASALTCTQVSGATFTITKAAAPVLTAYPVTRKYTLKTEQTIPLPGLESLGMPGNAQVSDTNAFHSESYSPAGKIQDGWGIDVNTGAITYTLAEGVAPGDVITFTLLVRSKNYEDAAVTVNLTLTERDTPILTLPDSITVDYIGAEIPVSAVTGKRAAFDGKDVPGTWSWKAGQTITNAADTGTKTIVFTPDDPVNYLPAEGTVSVTISPVAPAYTAPTAMDGLIYSGNAQALVNAGSTSHGKLLYSLSKDGAYSETVPTGTDAGEYTVWYKVAGDNNHTDTQPASVTVTVAPKTATATVTVSGDSLTYTGDPLKPGVIVKDGDTVISPEEYDVSYRDNVNAGTATVTVRNKAGGNYTVSGSTTFEIGKAASDVRTVPGVNTGLVYNGGEQTLVTTGTALGGKLKYRLGESGEFTEALPKAANAGTYTVSYMVEGDGNHRDSEVQSLTVTIDKAKVTVKALDKRIYTDDKAPDLSKPVLDKDYTVSAMFGEDALTGDITLTYVDASGTETTPDTTKVGKVIIRAGGLTAPNDNYTVVFADGKLTVDERPVYTIKATAGSHGSITPSGNVDVLHGGSQTFTIAANSGYAISNVKIDGVSIGAVKSYTFENVTENHTIEVTFMKANGNPQTGVMVDEVTGEYYVA